MITIMSNHTTGLCGNYNDIMADDFLAPNGLVEGTAVGFANEWKTNSKCSDITVNRGHPCSLSVDKGMMKLRLRQPQRSVPTAGQ